jgi:nucleoside-diphosphate-sugar epimerase
MSKYLVTGGAGFIGSNIVEVLLKRGEHVKVLDNFSTGKRENLDEFSKDIELIEGDIRDLGTVRRAVKDVDYVLHQAALPSVARSVKDPLSTNEVNIQGTLNILVAARDGGIKRVVYAGSSSAYGNTEILPKREDMEPRPISPYALTKLTGEKYCQMFTSLYGIETVVLRYFNVFGPRQDPNSQYSAAIPIFVRAMANKRPITIFGDGEQSRDFTFVENVVNANLLASTAEKVAGEVMNVGCGTRITVNELAKKICSIGGYDTEIVHTEPRAGDVRHSLADISRARDLLGYTPQVSIDEGLSKTVKWFLA